MKNRTVRAFRHGSLLLVLLLLCSLLTATGSATEVTEPVEETTSAYAATEQPEVKTYAIDTESTVYQSCQEAAASIDAAQILVYDATADEILYSKSVAGSKLYPASTTKLFSVSGCRCCSPTRLSPRGTSWICCSRVLPSPTYPRITN